jgi:hypothetical protein
MNIFRQEHIGYGPVNDGMNSILGNGVYESKEEAFMAENTRNTVKFSV